LSEHLGHTLNVHHSHYRLQEPIVEMSHLSRLLFAIESGRASEFVGKKLSDINVSGILLSNAHLLKYLVYHLVTHFYHISFILCKCKKIHCCILLYSDKFIVVCYFSLLPP